MPEPKKSTALGQNPCQMISNLPMNIRFSIAHSHLGLAPKSFWLVPSLLGLLPLPLPLIAQYLLSISCLLTCFIFLIPAPSVLASCPPSPTCSLSLFPPRSPLPPGPLHSPSRSLPLLPPSHSPSQSPARSVPFPPPTCTLHLVLPPSRSFRLQVYVPWSLFLCCSLPRFAPCPCSRSCSLSVLHSPPIPCSLRPMPFPALPLVLNFFSSSVPVAFPAPIFFLLFVHCFLLLSHPVFLDPSPTPFSPLSSFIIFPFSLSPAHPPRSFSRSSLSFSLPSSSMFPAYFPFPCSMFDLFSVFSHPLLPAHPHTL